MEHQNQDNKALNYICGDLANLRMITTKAKVTIQLSDPKSILSPRSWLNQEKA